MVRMYYVLVTGSARLSDDLVEFARALGRRIMAESDFVLVTGGLKQIEEGRTTADYEVVQGALGGLLESRGDSTERILTLVPEREFKEAKRFDDGKVERVKYSGLRSRRYAMVHRSDAVIAIEGHGATKENIDLAWTLGKPLLPVPCTGGDAKEAWDRYWDKLEQTLNLSHSETRILQGSLDNPKEVADCCVSILRRMIRPRCFVAMKFDDHPAPSAYPWIKEGAKSKGYEPKRTDELPGVGNIVDTIWAGIRSSDTFIADITGDSPNVFYELGIAHALHKEVIILLYDPSGEQLKKTPFDIASYRIHVYVDEQSLRTILERELNDQCR
jgi:predicted Rossmann-fold nucleotide-binding protein